MGLDEVGNHDAGAPRERPAEEHVQTVERGDCGVVASLCHEQNLMLSTADASAIARDNQLLRSGRLCKSILRASEDEAESIRAGMSEECHDA